RPSACHHCRPWVSPAALQRKCTTVTKNLLASGRWQDSRTLRLSPSSTNCSAKLWLERFDRALQAFLHHPPGPAAVIARLSGVLSNPLSDALKTIPGDRFRGVICADAFATEGFCELGQPFGHGHGRAQENEVPYLNSAVE